MSGELSVYPLTMADGTKNAIIGEPPPVPLTAKQIAEAAEGILPPGFWYGNPVVAKEVKHDSV